MIRHGFAALVAIVAAVALGAALVAACAGLFQTALELDAPPQRLANADAVVTAGEHAVLAAGDGKAAQTVTLTERGRLPADALQRVRAAAGVTRAVAVPELQAIAVTTDAPLRLPGLTVLTGDDRGRAEQVGVAGSRLKLVLLSSIFGGLALVVMGILLASIVGLSIEQRRRELALLRTIGATPKQVRRLVVRQTMWPAALAAVAGAFAGPVLARALFARVQDAGVVPQVLALRQGVLPLVVGAVAALLAVRVSAGLAARRAARARLHEALGEVEEAPGELGRVRVVLAAVAAVGAFSCGVTTLFMPPQNAAATGGGTALGGAIACALLAPWLTERLSGRLSGLFNGVPGELAVLNVRARAHRAAALVVPVILVVSVALANVYQQTTQANAMRSAYNDSVRPGAAHSTSEGWIEHPVDRSHRIDPWPLLGVEPPGLATPIAAGSLGPGVALPQRVADDLDVRVGDTIGIVLGDGAHVRLRVTALLDSPRRYAPIVLPRALLAEHAAARADLDTGLQVDAWITFAVVTVIVAYAALSLTNLLVASLAGRRHEFTLLRLAGATQRQVRRMLSAEALLIAAVGTIAGTAVAIAGLVPLAIATAGSPLPSGPVTVFAGVLAIVAALVLVPTLLMSLRKVTTHVE